MEDLCTGLDNLDPTCVARQKAVEVVEAGFDAVATSFAEAAESVAMSVTTSWTEIPSASATDEGAITLLQTDLRPVTATIATVALIAAAVRLAMSKRGEEASTLFVGMLRLLAVSTAGLAFFGLAAKAGDEFSQYILDRSTEGRFGSGELFVGALGNSALIFTVANIAIVASIIQIGLLLVRSASLVIMVGAWPLAAAAALHPDGIMIWKKLTAWIISFLLYKPIAAICYAAAFRLLNDASGDTSVVAAIEGVVLLVLAIVALPATIRLLTPTEGGMSAGPSAMGIATGATAVVAGGAAMAATGGAATPVVAGAAGSAASQVSQTAEGAITEEGA